MPWLARDRHIGALARLLHRHNLTVDTGWSAIRLLRVLEQHNRATGHLVPDPATQRNPLGYLNWLLTTATKQLTASSETPAGARRPAAAWRTEDAERRRQLAAEDPAAVAAAIAALRAQMNTSPGLGRAQRRP
jgi:hypothetical protein